MRSLIATTLTLLTLAGCHQPKRFREDDNARYAKEQIRETRMTERQEKVDLYLYEHDQIHKQINKQLKDRGGPSFRWSNPELEQFESLLDAMEDRQSEVIKLNPRYCDLMRREGHWDRIAGAREALARARAAKPPGVYHKPAAPKSQAACAEIPTDVTPVPL